MLRTAQQLNWQPFALEINPDLRKIVGDFYGVPMFGDMNDIPTDMKFDVIWMSYVACLLPNQLKRLKDLSTSSSRIFHISDPNYEGICVKRNGLLHYYYSLPQINFWKRKSLVLL